MARLRKLSLAGAVYFVTAGVEEGLLFTANPLITFLLEGVIARALSLYPIDIVKYVIEPTHVHFVVVVHNPDDLKNFMDRFKTESSHFMNTLIGRRQHTIWKKGYDSPVLLTVEDVIEKLVYIETNPVKDGLVDLARDYPGCSSLLLERSSKNGGTVSRSCPWVHRYMVPTLSRLDLGVDTGRRIVRQIQRLTKEEERCTLTIAPKSWMGMFNITASEEQELVYKQIKDRVAEVERVYREERVKSGRRVIGRKYLLSEPINTRYERKLKEGRRTWCICRDIDLRKRFISLIKELVKEAKEVYQAWLAGDYDRPYPIGLYPPSMVKRAEFVGVCAFVG